MAWGALIHTHLVVLFICKRGEINTTGLLVLDFLLVSGGRPRNSPPVPKIGLRNIDLGKESNY